MFLIISSYVTNKRIIHGMHMDKHGENVVIILIISFLPISINLQGGH